MVYELRERREGFIIPPIYLFCHSRPPRFGRLEITTGVRPSSVDHRTLRPAGWRGVNRSTRSSTAMCHRYSIFTTRNRNPGVDVTPGTKDRTHQPQSCRRRTTVHDAAFSRGRRHEASQPASYTHLSCGNEKQRIRRGSDGSRDTDRAHIRKRFTSPNWARCSRLAHSFSSRVVDRTARRTVQEFTRPHGSEPLLPDHHGSLAKRLRTPGLPSRGRDQKKHVPPVSVRFG